MTRTNLNFNNLLWLAGAMALIILPHISRLPIWVSLLSTASISYRIYLSRTQRALPNKWLIMLIAVLSMIGVQRSFGILLGRDSGIAILVILLGLKLLETKNQRDVSIIIFLSYFLLLTNFLYSQTISTAVYLLFTFWVVNTTLINFNLFTAAPGYRQRLKISGVMILQALPLMLVLFVFFPRVQGPLWGLPSDTRSAISGLSDSMSPGSISSLGLSDAIAFRVNFERVIPASADLYWRGPVFVHFDGKTWTPGPYIEAKQISYKALSSPIDYQIILEPHHQRWLFALDLPGMLAPNSIITQEFQLLARRVIHDRLPYSMRSHIKYQIGEVLTDRERKSNLQVPRNSNPRARDLAERLKKESETERKLINHVLRMFREQKFFYTLTPPLLGPQPVDEFLFDTRSGFCEHYASAFAFIMRVAGIPARIVTGYQGGETNPYGNYLIIRQTDAHAWAEVWLKDEGWVRVDPTAAVAPSRIEFGITAALPITEPLPLLARKEYNWLRQVRLSLDAVSYTWNQWILGYNPQRQIEFLSQFGFRHINWQRLAFMLMTSLIILIIPLSLFILKDLHLTKRDQVEQIWLRFCKNMAKRGWPRHTWEGPADYITRIQITHPECASLLQAIKETYINLRYGKSADQEMIKMFDNKVRELSTRRL